MLPSNRTLLVGAALAAPLLVVVWAVQSFTRDGFRPAYHPMSLLALGDGGWVQVGNFVVTGALLVGGGLALRRALEAGRLSRWASVLVVLMGVGLVVAGVFVTDAGAGFPAGAPEGAPVMTWHGALHQAGFVLTQLAFVALGVVLTVRAARAGRRGWAVAAAACVGAAVGVAAAGAPETLALRLVVASAVELGLVSALALSALARDRRDATAARHAVGLAA